MAVVGGNLPEDLVINILSRLPVKSLMRFKCVCKSWRSLFETTGFVAKHLKDTTRRRDNNGGCLFYKRVDHNDSRKHSYSLLSYETLEVVTANLDFPYLKDERILNMSIAGCCDGIICAYYVYESGIVLWNPATRELKVLPQSHVPRRTDNSVHGCPLGFGFDPKSKDYKVVHLVEFGATSLKPSHNYQVEVYDLSADSWRKSDAVVPAGVLAEKFGQLVPYAKGNFSWFAIDKCRRGIIVSFDMIEEVIKTTPLPDVCAGHKSDYVRSLTVLNESLALINHPRLRNHVCEVWVLNEYGVKESWTKLYTFGPLSELRSPSGFWKNSHMFVETINFGVALLDMVTQEMKDIHFDNCMLNVFVFYKESLIPLKGFPCFDSRVPRTLPLELRWGYTTRSFATT